MLEHCHKFQPKLKKHRRATSQSDSQSVSLGLGEQGGDELLHCEYALKLVADILNVLCNKLYIIITELLLLLRDAHLTCA